MSKHTLPPWKTDGLAVVGSSDDLEVCICTWDELTPRHVSEVNARLIAAAPDLLAALEALVDDCESASGLSDYNYGNFELVKAKKAIKRAKGE